MKKILIEFYDEENLNNCISQLYFDYDAVYYLSFHKIKGNKKNALVKTNKNKIGITPEFRVLEDDGPDEIIAAIKAIVNDTDSFDFDITGGLQTFSYAVGKFISENSPKNVNVQYFDFEKREFFRVYPERKEKKPPLKRALDVDELIELQACCVFKKDGKDYRPEIDENYSKKILDIWKCVKNYQDEWKSFCSARNENKRDLIINYADTGYYIMKILSGDIQRNTEMLLGLEEAGIIKIKVLTEKYVSYRITLPPSQRDLMEKCGNILEMYSYYMIKSTGRFNDCCVGVHLDWDGKNHGRPDEITNEADLVLSDGYRPIFISCKTAKKPAEKKLMLYEIDTIAWYYGGKLAKPVFFSSNEESGTIKKRAEESGIVLIDNIAGMTQKEFRDKIKELL